MLLRVFTLMPRFHFNLPCALCALVSLSAVGIARANLFVNGDFENTPLPANASPTASVGVGAGTSVSGWTTTLSTGDTGKNNYFNGASQTTNGWIPAAQSGTYSVQLDSRPGSGVYTIGNSIYQSLNLTANTAYSLSFYFRSETGNTTNVLTSVNAYVGLNSQGDVPVDAAGYNSIAAQRYVSPVAVDTGWNLATLNFRVTTAGLYRFTFLDGAQSLTNTGYPAAPAEDSNASLDNFQLNVVPEFSHWTVFGVFGLLVAGAGRRRVLSAWSIGKQT